MMSAFLLILAVVSALEYGVGRQILTYKKGERT